MTAPVAARRLGNLARRTAAIAQKRTAATMNRKPACHSGASSRLPIRIATRLVPISPTSVTKAAIVAWFSRAAVGMDADTVLSCLVPGSGQRGLRLGTLIPRFGPARPDDRLFVPFAGKEHDVARAGALDRRIDGGSP